MRQQLRRVTIVLASLMAVGAALKAASRDAEASSGLNNALETIGIATGIGTVLGLSTIAFYDSPTSHMGNALVGAGAGLIVGLGVASYMAAVSPDEDEISPEELLPPENKPKGSGQDLKKDLKKDPTKTGNPGASLRRAPRRFDSSVPVALALPMSARKEWAVAWRVLELRF